MSRSVSALGVAPATIPQPRFTAVKMEPVIDAPLKLVPRRQP